jgi:PIN domain nuclease of toxin-antitoxin system
VDADRTGSSWSRRHPPPHTFTARALPPHHRDPFDRLLLAQAESLGLPLITFDRQLASYGIDVLEIP